jgi:chorismate dehydratase
LKFPALELGASVIGTSPGAYPALRGLRIGCVQYLNSKPLIHDYDGPVVFDHPSGLARDLAAGRLDAALVPIFEVLRGPGYHLVDGVAIACDGPVFSVFLAHRGPLAAVKTIALDPASLTSVHLLQVLLAEFHGLHPQCRDARTCPDADAQLWIGNQAIDFRLADRGQHELLDLGAEWKRCTGLPFVFAVWALRPDLADPIAVADNFRALKRAGLASLPAIVAADQTLEPALSTRYLTEHIRFDLAQREKAAMDGFASLLVKHRFLPTGAAPLAYV